MEDKEYNLTLKEAVGKEIISVQLIAYFLGKSLHLFEAMGINPKLLKLRQHKDDERAFYATDTWDVEYISPSACECLIDFFVCQ